MGTDREEYQAAIGGTFITRNMKRRILGQRCDMKNRMLLYGDLVPKQVECA